jgi:NADPH2:quinone reductase
VVRAWRVTKHGRPSDALRLDDIPVPEPSAGEVRVRTTSTVCNFNEIDGCRGRYLTVDPPLPYTLGMEVLGEVVATGPGAQQWLGRRVVATATNAYGAHAEEVLVSADMTFDAPDELDDVDAAAFFFPFHLAHLGLHERGNLRTGETVLVHAAAGGVGSAAVQLAVAAGARVIATAGGDAKLALCRELGAEVVVDYRKDDFVEAVFAATDDRGADVCFDGVGGEVMDRSLSCLARNGRHLIIGFASGIEAEDRASVTGRTLCFGNIALVGVMLSYRSAPPARTGGLNVNQMPRRVGDHVHEQLVGLLRAGRIRPVVGRTVPFDELPAALDEMEDRATIGRVVVRWR